MKTFNSNYIIVILLLITCFSCNKEKNEPIIDGDKINIVFTIAGVKNNQLNKYASTARSVFGEEKKIESLNFNNIDMEISTQENAMSGITIDKKEFRKLAETQKMAEGIKYRIMLYNTTTQKIEQSVLATAGTAVEIPVFNNQTYNYYAFSYNKTEDIVDPGSSAHIATPTDSDLLYDNGTISTDVVNKPIAITFEHKVAEVVVELDYDRLFGSVTNENIEFVENNYLTKGRLDLATGNLDNHQVYTTSTINFSEVDPINRLRRARYYVSDPSNLGNIKIRIQALNGVYVNNATWEITNIPQIAEFKYTSPVVGQQLVSSIKLFRRFSQKKILHCVGFDAFDYGYVAQNHASGNMLNEPRNYGSLTNSIVRFNSGVTNAFVHKTIYYNNNNQLINEITNFKPDIIITGYSYNFATTANSEAALLDYVRNGGVLLMLTGEFFANEQTSFMQQLIGSNNISISSQTHPKGYVYEYISVNDELIHGAFGNVAGKAWGEDDGHAAQLILTPSGSSLPEQLVSYSKLNPINKPGIATDAMLARYTKYHYFWFGDAGFLANNLENGISNETSDVWSPFATVNTATAPNTLNPQFNYNNYPIPKPNFGDPGSYNVYNSTFFANVMSWAIACAEFYGINGGNFPSGGMTDNNSGGIL